MKSVRSKVLLLLFAPLSTSQSSAFVLTFRKNCSYYIGPKSTSTAILAEPANNSSSGGSISSSSIMTVNRKQLLVSLCDNLSCDNDDNKPKLILASQSPRRREILTMMGLTENKHYTVEYSPLDESILQKELVESKLPSIDYTRRLAEAKAYALADLHANGDNNKNNEAGAATFYLGSDTIVELDECILEKPKDTNDAKRMLNLLSGRQHHVHTGVALYRLNGNANNNQNQISLIESFTDTACVTFADLTDEDIDSYIKSGEPMDKSGSYGAQGIGGQFVKTISGDFFTVMGLPMHKTSQLVASALQAE
jgi:septum formation protein